MLCDTHIHSSFSTDSSTDPVLIIEKSIALNIPTICFTDHCDLDYPASPDLFQLDFDRYFSSLSLLQKKYSSQIKILVGVEMGLQAHLNTRIDAILKEYPFDFVIGSTHTVNGKDPAFPDFYQYRTISTSLQEYFTSIFENLQSCPNFDSCGHLDYAVRYSPEKDKDFHLENHLDIIDKILNYLISNQKSLEINTGGFRCGLNRTNPGELILNRYLALGGSQITIGSDAHTIPYLAAEFKSTQKQLKSLGFHEYCIYENRKRKYLPL